MCTTTSVALKTKRMLAVTPTNLLRLRPYDLSDARHLVEQFGAEKSKDCKCQSLVNEEDWIEIVLLVMNQINYETARLFVQGQTTLYFVMYSEQQVTKLKTNNDGLLQMQQPYCLVKNPAVVVYLQNDTLAKTITLAGPAPEGHYCLINNRVYVAQQQFTQNNEQLFKLLAVPLDDKDKMPPQKTVEEFPLGTKYTEIGMAILL